MNEAPYPPAPAVLEAAGEALTELNRYADPAEMEGLRESLADYCQLSKDHIALSPGSDLLLREVIHTFSKGRKVITVTPSFLPTVQAAKHFAPEYLSIRLSPPTFELNLEFLMSALEGPCLLIIDNPNNPTGNTLLGPAAVEALLKHDDVLLVLDEAYYEFSGVTFAPMVASSPRLMIVRTLDKAFSLAGARVGYGIVGKGFGDLLSSFCTFLPRPSLYAAIAAIRQSDYMQENVSRVVKERMRLRQRLQGLGIRVYPSDTNFLLVRTEIPDSVLRLKDAGVLVHDASNQLPAGFVRVSVGTPEENDAFVGALTQQMKA
jgi:histidinol-phosphate aminotransferase